MRYTHHRLRHRKLSKLKATLAELGVWDAEMDSPLLGSLVIIRVYRPRPSIDSEGNVTPGTFVAYSAQFKLPDGHELVDRLDKDKGDKIAPPGPPDFVNPSAEATELFDCGLPNGVMLAKEETSFCVWAGK